jgi:hypothetical protein
MTTWPRIFGDSSRLSAQEISNDVIDTFNFAKGKTRCKFPRRSNRVKRAGPLTGRANFRSGLLPRRMLDFSSRQPLLWNVDDFNSCACGDVWTSRFLCSAWRALPTPEVLQAADMVWVPPGCRSRRLPQADNRPSAGRSAPMLKTLRQPAAQR